MPIINPNERGLDLASVDGNAAPNYPYARQYASWLYLRRSFCEWTGTKFVCLPDHTYDRDYQIAKDAGFKVGGYAIIGYWKGCPSAQDQIHTAIDAGNIKPGEDLLFSIDVEFPGGSKKMNQSISELVDMTHEAVQVFDAIFGVKPACYTSYGEIHDSDTGLGNPAMPFLADCPLWVKTAYVVPEDRPLYFGSISFAHEGHDEAVDQHDYYRTPAPWDGKGWWYQQVQGDCLRFPSTNSAISSAFNKTVDINRFHYLSKSTPNDPRVTDVQKRIAVIGAPMSGPLNVTGVWDADTEHAVRAYQTSKGLVPDGVIGPATWAHLGWEKIGS